MSRTRERTMIFSNATGRVDFLFFIFFYYSIAHPSCLIFHGELDWSARTVWNRNTYGLAEDSLTVDLASPRLAPAFSAITHRHPHEPTSETRTLPRTLHVAWASYFYAVKMRNSNKMIARVSERIRGFERCHP